MSFYFNPQGVLRLREWDQYPWLVHGFGTRRHPDPSPNGTPARTLRQIHSAIVRLPGDGGVEGDALIAAEAGELVGVKTADCLPVLVVDIGKRVAAAIHAGWRGMAKRVVQKTVGEMRRHYGSEPRDLRAAIGPGIRVCCYEVGPEVLEEFESQFTDSERFCRREAPNPALTMLPRQHLTGGHALMRDLESDRGRVDLAEAAKCQLERAGVATIFDSQRCTACDLGRFYSYRREREAAGRMISIIGLRNQSSGRVIPGLPLAAGSNHSVSKSMPQGHLWRPACQFSTTETGRCPSSSNKLVIRKRRPSAVGW
jgi:hypothetical protein